MGLRLRILRLVHPESGGPRPRRLLVAMARTMREKSRAELVVAQMIERGELVKYGDRKGTKYGLPGRPARRSQARRRRRFWTSKATARVKGDYPHMATWKIARALKRPIYAIYRKAVALGLRKSAEYLAGPDACRLRRGNNVGAAYRFKPGQVPANKGLRRPGWFAGRMKETQFRKGERNWHQMPIGATRLVEGYLYLKVAEVPHQPYTVNWKPLHILDWERANGRPMPEGHVLRFRDGNRLNVALANLELLTRRENARRNSMHRLPESIKRAIFAKAALVRRIHRMEEQRAEDA